MREGEAADSGAAGAGRGINVVFDRVGGGVSNPPYASGWQNF